MLVGNPKTFAIESSINKAYLSIGRRALGYFVIYVGGIRYGVRHVSASLLACSFDEVTSRIGRRGTHRMPCLVDQPASIVAYNIVDAIYGDGKNELHFGMTRVAFEDALGASRVHWIPDGDAAFDDSSHILHLDVESRVRLIAFRINYGIEAGAEAVKSIWIDANTFYHVLAKWHQMFETEWAERFPKM